MVHFDIPSLNFKFSVLCFGRVGHALVGIKPIFMLFVTISSCLMLLFQGHIGIFYLTGPHRYR